MHWIQKAGLGALGGFCLVLVRLLLEGFFFSSAVNGAGVFLAASTMILLAAIWTLTEDEEEIGKLIRFGFAAPGLLLLIVNQSASVTDQRPSLRSYEIQEIGQSVGALNLPRKSPEEFSRAPAGEAAAETLSLKNIRPALSSGARAFIGLPYDDDHFAYVVGKSRDLNRANDLANQLNGDSGDSSRIFRVLKIEELNLYFVIGGSVSGYSQASSLRESLVSESMNAALARKRPAAAMLLKGGVVDLRSLEHKK